MKAIETQKLTKYYGKARGIIDVDLNVETGDFYGFIGPNGAGKSTTIRTLLGLIQKTSGDAQIFGRSVSTDSKSILRDIGYLPSETNFYNSMKVGDLLKLSAQLRGIDCSKERDILCERLSLDTTKHINSLSFGNRKKVGIVCALQHNPKLLILDEPTSSLDPLIQREFYSILNERNENGVTVFLSSHVLSEVGKYCKKAAIIRDGRILVADTVEKLAYTGIKRVSIKSDKTVALSDKIKNIKTEQDTTSFLYSGSSSELLEYIRELSPQDFTVADPDLEEVFMHYYKKEG